MRSKKTQHIPIILASTSPRRIDLMNQVQFIVEVQSPQTDEKPKKNEKPKTLVSRLAWEKAESIRDLAMTRYDKSVIIAADTVVVAPDGKQILGKPRNTAEAYRMLKKLSGKKHTVFTGYCLLLASKQKPVKQTVRVIQSKVKMRSLTKHEIIQYIASGEPMDKAGAYGAQGLGMLLIEKIEGSYTNVVGLPMAQVFSDLAKDFDIPLFSRMS